MGKPDLEIVTDIGGKIVAKLDLSTLDVSAKQEVKNAILSLTPELESKMAWDGLFGAPYPVEVNAMTTARIINNLVDAGIISKDTIRFMQSLEEISPVDGLAREIVVDADGNIQSVELALQNLGVATEGAIRSVEALRASTLNSAIIDEFAQAVGIDPQYENGSKVLEKEEKRAEVVKRLNRDGSRQVAKQVKNGTYVPKQYRYPNPKHQAKKKARAAMAKQSRKINRGH